MSEEEMTNIESAPWVEEPEPGQYRLAFERLPTPQELTESFSIRNNPRILAFVYQSPHLGPLLLEAKPVILRFFPAHDLLLRLGYNPETSTQQIKLAIITKLRTDEALERLDAFYETWWFDQAERAHDDLVIDVEWP